MTDFLRYPNLAAERFGARAVVANDEFFAAKENLLRGSEPVFEKGVYGDHGQVMDGWETRRRRGPGNDWCVIELGAPGIVHGVVVDTAHFLGNYPESCSVEGAFVEGTIADVAAADVAWTSLVAKTPLEGGAAHEMPVAAPQLVTHVRLSIYPDGGVARFRVHGRPAPAWEDVLATGDHPDLALLAHGGYAVDASDAFYSSPNQLLLAGPSLDMGDGWETRRRRGPGNDWCVIALGVSGVIDEIELATTHYKGNAPAAVQVEAANRDHMPEEPDWEVIVPRTDVAPHSDHRFAVERPEPVTHVRLSIYPDGGVARLRVLGSPTRDGLARAGVARLDHLADRAAQERFLSCCGSQRWAEVMSAARPFGTIEELLAAADRAWAALPAPDRMEAFDAHPRIGDRQAAARVAAASARSASWSRDEQAKVGDGNEEVLGRLAARNRDYEARFGHVFLVSASGKSAEEILDILDARIDNTPEQELANAAHAQAGITRLRLRSLVGAEQSGAET
jgi:allantoicase